MKKFIVTGGSGFIGSNLVKFLLSKNYFVINVDKLSYSANPYNLKQVIGNKNYRFFKQDINNQTQIFDILKRFKPNGIFNLAAETHVDRSIDDPKKFINNNILGVYNLLEALNMYAKRNKKKIKLIHVSTDEVYGDIKMGKRSDENFSYNPSSPYSASKASADHIIKSFVRTYKLPAVISNCCNNYGPNQFPEKLIPKLIYNIINNKPLPIYARGKNSREWIYVLDHCEALLKIFFKGKIGESYNVGSNQNINNVNLTKKLLKIVKNKSFTFLTKKVNKEVKIMFVKDRPGHDFRYALNSNKILKKLGWKPKISLHLGLSQTFDWYINNKSFFNSASKKLHINRLGLRT